MSGVGKLNVRVTATNKGLVDTLGKSRREIKDFSRDASTTMKGFNLFGGMKGLGMGLKSGMLAAPGLALKAMKSVAVGAGAAGVGIAAGVKVGADAIDDLSDASQRTFGTGSTGALAGMRLAAEEAGVEAAALDASLMKMQGNLGKAASGSKKAGDAFGALGLNVKSLLALSPEKRFGQISDAIAQIQDPAQQISAAQSIFGKSGGDLTPLFRQGSEAIAKATADMKTFGFALGQVDADKVGKMNDNFGRLGKAALGFGAQLAVNVAPYVNNITDRALELLKNWGGMEGLAAKTFDQVKTGAELVLDASEHVYASFTLIADASTKIYETWKAIKDVMGDVGGVLTWNPIRDAVVGKIKDRVAENREANGGRSWAERTLPEDSKDLSPSERKAVRDAERRERRAKSGTDAATRAAFGLGIDGEGDAAEMAEGRLDTERGILDTIKEQNKERMRGEAGQGRAALTAFNGPVAAFEAATAHMGRANAAQDQVDVLKKIADSSRQIAQNTRSQSVALG